jgi:hypothetical protein
MLGDVAGPFLDLIDLAVYVYCADQAVSRGAPTDRNFGEDWRRRLHFRVPVRCPDLWNDSVTGGLLVEALSFLSEDEYHFRFEPLRDPPPLQSYFPYAAGGPDGPVEEVVLFSGGLDSLGGAVREAVGGGRRVALVQHRGSGKGTPRLDALFQALRAKAGAAAPHLVPVTINKEEGLTREYTQRTRSFLYASLGAALAAALGLPRLRVYENGVISLNLPPSAQVVGARASRTTHPRALAAMARLFTRLAGGPFAVENPFQWLTKGQVIEGIAAAGCADLIRLTASCAYPRGASAEVPHCGRCSQCIDRRFAVLAAGQAEADSASGYALDLMTGARAEGHPRTMLAVYVATAEAITRMTPAQFFGRFGEAARVIRHTELDPEAAAGEIFRLYRRHAEDVMRVVQEGIAAHAAEIPRRSLPPSCLVRLVCDASGGGPAPATPEPPGAPQAADYFFRHRGAVWEFRYAGGEPQILTASRGAAYLHQLLAQPEVAVPAVRLAYNVVRDERLLAAGGGDRVLDGEGLATYRAAYEDAQHALEEAKANNDLGAQERAEHDLAILAGELERHQGLGRSRREAVSDREKVRKAVGNAINRAVKEIHRYDRRFAEHLSPPRLTCGNAPCYRPGTEAIRWET